MADPACAFKSRQSRSGENRRDGRSHVDVATVDDWMLQNEPNFCSRLEQLTVSMRVSVQPAGSVEFIEEKRWRTSACGLDCPPQIPLGDGTPFSAFYRPYFSIDGMSAAMDVP